MRYFDLEGHEINEEHFCALYANTQMRLFCQTETATSRISTVWLGIDHAFDGGPPLIFETLVFGGPMDMYRRRYSTIEQARAGHNEIVTLEAMEREFV